MLPESAGVVLPVTIIRPDQALDLGVIAGRIADAKPDGILVFVNSAVPHVTTVARTAKFRLPGHSVVSRIDIAAFRSRLIYMLTAGTMTGFTAETFFIIK